MKIFPLSDTHNEFGDYPYDFPDCDVICLCGDIGTKTSGIKWAIEMSHKKNVKIIYINGNHEYYGAKLSQGNHLQKHQLSLSEGTNVHFLEKSSVVIDGVRFIGTTLWTDYTFNDIKAKSIDKAKMVLNDYKKIRMGIEYGWRKFNPIYAINEYNKCFLWLNEELQKSGDWDKTVVMTHHSPSGRSLEDEYKDDVLSPAYAGNLDDFILKNQYDLHIHGHIHSKSDYTVGNTRVIANPLGYYHIKNDKDAAVNKNFDPNWIINI